MTGAMYAGVAGLRTHMSALNVIGNNVANVNTDAYKSKRYVFSEALYTSVHSGSDGTTVLGGRNPAQIGYGVSVGSIDLDMSTKSYHPTGMPTDCMIDGDGFFIVGDKTKNMVKNQEELQGMSLTRRGDFTFINGYLVDGEGQVVYGFLNTKVEANEETDSPDDIVDGQVNFKIPVLTPIRLPKMYETVGADGNTKVNIIWPQWGSVNADAGAGDGENTIITPQYGNQVNDKNPTIAEGDKQKELDWVVLQNISIEETGRIIGTTADKRQITVGYIAVAKVDNPNGVTHVDGHYYQAQGGAGKVHLCSPGGAVQYVAGASADENGLRGDWTALAEADLNLNISQAGKTGFVSGGLEMSGTDLATEISNMICIQRGYQANTRIVTVTDSMLEELVNMKR